MAGCTVAVGNRVGARDEQGQRRAFAASLGVALLGAAAITLAGCAFAMPIFTLMGVPGASLAQTAAYLEVVSLGTAGLFLLNAAQAAAPVLPALVGFVYLQLWERRNLTR